jgi:hypothetical protein
MAYASTCSQEGVLAPFAPSSFEVPELPLIRPSTSRHRRKQ